MLERILGAPHLAQVVPRLAPELIHRVIQQCGLEACGDLLTLATPAQLTRILDLDLWHSPRPGLDERFDPARFGVWLEVLVETGVSVAARTLAGMDVDLAVAGLSQHVLVFDAAAVGAYTTTDGVAVPARRSVDDGLACELGGFLLLARGGDAWDAIAAVLTALDAEHPACFQQVMAGCRALSNSTPEADGFHDLLDDDDQALFDLASERSRRHERSGYLSPAQARAFLQMARESRLKPGGAMPVNPIARAYFRGIDEPAPPASRSHAGLPSAASDHLVEDEPATLASVIHVLGVLREGGIFVQPRGLLDPTPGHSSPVWRVQACMQFLLDHDAGTYAVRTGELAFLGNAIMAGCSFQARPWRAEEAADAAAAICNLGLENREAGGRQPLPDAFLADHDLIGVFQLGWTVLYEEVAMYTAERLIKILGNLRCADREIQAGLDTLRFELTKHRLRGTPWRARDALDVMTSLDMPSWAALLALLDECPVLHAGVAASRDRRMRSVDPAAFQFISENRQVASARLFVDTLPETLRRALGTNGDQPAK
jgi:hypothetical protein